MVTGDGIRVCEVSLYIQVAVRTDWRVGWLYGGSIFFFQAEDGIRDLVRSRGLGDVYKRQFQVSNFSLRRPVPSG